MDLVDYYGAMYHYPSLYLITFARVNLPAILAKTWRKRTVYTTFTLYKVPILLRTA
ncbi:hypothetical protein C8R41DRAFT_809342 [Lentinula lateritia]|uniref:Uncharacterized protein n=1 Tax=Lentinula lateritia TaxID=40482 RepID=A0ABQ8VWY5_9AGAR|nr:hypothetical protein C8R41DRAFT_809342 [Lentinula lateritia]